MCRPGGWARDAPLPAELSLHPPLLAASDHDKTLADGIKTSSIDFTAYDFMLSGRNRIVLVFFFKRSQSFSIEKNKGSAQ